MVVINVAVFLAMGVAGVGWVTSDAAKGSLAWGRGLRAVTPFMGNGGGY